MQNYTGLEIAVIGMSGRFPGAATVQEFWNNLKKGVESITVLSEAEILAEGEDPLLLRDPDYVKASAFLEGKEYFDAAFFNYRPDEAALMDPQMRLFHECVWQALEDAGCDPADEEHRIALFAGTSINMNWEVYAALANRENLVDAYSAVQLRNARFLPTKISYAFNLRGPSMLVDTACSTSLAAIHQACRSLIVGDCTIALAGGVAISNRSRKGYKYEKGMIHSPDGHCRPFDKDAQGTVSGEGIGIVVLKKLKKALADNDNILAVIRGSGINNDGNNKVGYTAPSIDGQVEAILMAQKWGKTAPHSISYIEAHGTGTRLGDPVEVEALNRAFGKSTEPYCAIGAVKSNIGHLDAAAGVAGFIKTVLALQHRQLPASLHYQEANAAINFRQSPFYVNTALKPWSHGEYPLRAGVSSFGIGGTNVHVVLEEAPVREPSSSSRTWQLLTFSAKTPAALERNMIAFRDFLAADPAINLADTVYTLQTGRTALAFRSTIVCKSTQEAIALLSEKATAVVPPVDDKQAPLIVFMFSGQGSQYVNMCRDLYRDEELFRTTADQCFTIVQKLLGRDLRTVVFSADPSAAAHQIDNTENTQPLLFILEYALARLLMQWGIQPDLMIGHSIGEYVAACLSGVFTLEDALRLVVKRGALMQQAPRGVMLGVSMSEHELHPLLHVHHDIALATVNSSDLCVVAGEADSIGSFKTIIEQSGYNSTLLHTSHAFHSQMMDGILDAFEAEVRRVTIHPQQIPFISNISGKRAEDADIARPEYWVRHLRHTVRFSEGIVTAFENKHVLFIETGPGKSLSTFVRSHRLRQSGHKVINMVRHPKEAENDLAYLLAAIGECWIHGLTPDWKGFYEKEHRRKVSLPAYSFERVKYPANVDAYRMIHDLQADSMAIKDPAIANWLYTPSWKLAVPLPGQGTAETTDSILLFSDACGIGEALTAKLQAQGRLVIQVQAGARFLEIAPDSYELHPAEAEGYEQLLRSLVKHGLQPRAIVHGWSIGHQQEHEYSSDAYHHCFKSLVQWVQVCQSAGRLRGSRVVVLTSDQQAVLDKAGNAAVTSLAPAFLKVLSQEYPSVSTRYIDIGMQEIIAGNGLSALCREIDSHASGQVIALRHGRRWERVFHKALDNDLSLPTDLRAQGVYLITGGLGGVGFVLAGQLMKRLQARVIITGRTTLPPRGEWENCLQAASTSVALQQKIKRLQALEAEGGALLYLPCNVANAAEVLQMVQTAETVFGPINGVFHAAGVVDGRSIGAIGGLTEEDFSEQFEAKIAGLHALHSVMQNKELDFCLLTSSLAAVLGGIGFGAYAPANAYMDHFLSVHAETTPQWVSVNIDGIDTVGKHAAAIRPEELYELIEKVLQVKYLRQVTVSTTDLQKRLETWVYRRPQQDAEGDAGGNNVVNSAQQQQLSGSTTAQLTALWQSFFGKPEIGVHDDFFEVGGDSLKALTMIGRIYKAFNVEVPIQDFFKRPSIRQLSDYLDTAKKRLSINHTNYAAIPQAPERNHYALSSAQQRLYFLYELDKTSVAYNLFQATTLKGAINIEKLRNAFNRLLDRHEILRTAFVTIDGLPVQKIAQQTMLDIELLTASAAAVPAVIDAFIRPFDLGKAPLIRAGLIEVAPHEHILVVDMPHIISDGVSQGIMINDFMAFYRGEELPALQLQYKDYSDWQQGTVRQELLLQHRDFLVNAFAQLPPPLDLPMDFTRPPMRDYRGHTVHFYISPEQTAALRSIALRENVSQFVLLLSALNVLLRKLTNQEDIVTGTNTAGRRHPDLEQLIGIFVTTLPLRTFPAGDLTFRQFLLQVQTAVLSFFEHEAYEYEALIDDLKIDRDQSRNPLFDVLFLYQNFSVTRFEIPGLHLVTYDIPQTRSKFDLSLIVVENDDRLLCAFEYATALFSQETIETFISYFTHILSSVIADMDRRLEDF